MNKFGFLTNKFERVQRWRCSLCLVTKTDDRALGDVRVNEDTVIRVVEMLCEGIGIRACERLARVHRDTVMNILRFAGARSVETFNNHVLNTPIKAVQIDELYAFVLKKERNCLPHEYNYGDQYTYLALDPDSKLILAFATGKRDQTTTDEFISDLSIRVDRKNPFDITTDGFPCYNNPIAQYFYGNASYAQLVKNFHLMKIAKSRNERIPCMERNIIFGKRENQSISTSYVERLNLSVRLFNKRFTRRTICYSKTLDNLRHSVCLFVAHYNFCRVHSSIKCTPAMKAGLIDRALNIRELLGIQKLMCNALAA